MAKIDFDIGLTVQETAARTGLSVHTLRYYERAGLLDNVGRDVSSNHRRYTDADLARIQFVKKMRATGMPISKLQHYVALLSGDEATVEERQQILAAHREQVCAQITELSECLSLIDFKIKNYILLEEQRKERIK